MLEVLGLGPLSAEGSGAGGESRFDLVGEL